ncbi:CHAT domain-containing protein [Spirulina sp. 06S082]|uniref:CHAT domain-containing protein n=1 Tax=Spirulina sp. 06S082 TaxID=3110248 RepID=UPI002B211AC4|nr:CHAT domain-containing protein [Spirulina sp. 06S082]MEA5467883.1 CHAT domain-containing protein [Spirulina sp. 06S082]
MTGYQERRKNCCIISIAMVLSLTSWTGNINSVQANIITLPDGTECTGDFQGGQLNGRGRCSYGNGNSYEGEFRDGEENGQGLFLYVNGDRYEGQFRDGQRNGFGIFYFINGDRYEGQFRDDKLNGIGRLIFANGDRYEGEFRDDKRNGRGIFYFVNGDRYEGEFRDNKRSGEGQFIFANGDRYEGEFRNDRRNGRGILVFANGDRQEGIWVNDELTNEVVDYIEQSRRKAFEDYFGTRFSDEEDHISLTVIQKNLEAIERQTGQKLALIYVTSHPHNLELILITAEGYPVIKRIDDLTPEYTLAVAAEFRRQITSGVTRTHRNYLPYSQQLYQWLIAPIASHLERQEIDTLLFSLDTGLRSIPLAALHDGEQFLVEKYSSSIIPSFSLTNTFYNPLENARILAMGASQFRENSPLPAIPLELALIQNSASEKTFLNEDFTLENLQLQRRLFPFRIIHLATHAEFKPGHPSNSYIQLWDRKLTLNELGKLNWNNPPVDLLVLSACRTAFGDEQAELGFAGLALQTGAKSVLASLWYVSDLGTLVLMGEFYNNLTDTSLKSEALRQAQLAMLRGEVVLSEDLWKKLERNPGLVPEAIAMRNASLSHPYYWSSFTLIGSPL